MALQVWPTYVLDSIPPVTLNCEIQGATIQIEYPGRRTTKAQFSNKELVHDVSEGEWRGSVQIASQQRNGPAHIAIQTFLAEMNANPGVNYTEFPWEKPSIFTLNSTVPATHAINTQDNDMIATMSRVSGGVGRVTANLARQSSESITISQGEHIGYGKKTYKIIAATVTNPNLEWDIQCVPALPDTTTSGDIFKRIFLPCRIVGGQKLQDTTQGASAGPWAFEVVEEAVD